MAEVAAFGGTTVDHLYANCPNLQRAKPDRSLIHGETWVGQRLKGTVDPLGTDICGLCRHRYERTNRD